MRDELPVRQAALDAVHEALECVFSWYCTRGYRWEAPGKQPGSYTYHYVLELRCACVSDRVPVRLLWR